MSRLHFNYVSPNKTKSIKFHLMLFDFNKNGGKKMVLTFLWKDNILHRSLNYINYVLKVVSFNECTGMFRHLSCFHRVYLPCTSLC